MQFNIKKTESNQKISRRFKKHFSKDDKQMAKRQFKRYLVSLIIREMKAKTATGP